MRLGVGAKGWVLTGSLVGVLIGSGAGAIEPESPPSLPPVPGLPDSGDSKAGTSASGTALTGIFRLLAGTCAGGGVTAGSFFRMFDPGGGLVTNGSSSCGDKTFTPLRPGTDGGLATNVYQSNPSPAFDAQGNGLNAKITQPQAFYGTRFSTATNSIDPQSSADVSAPRILNEAGTLSGDLRAFAAGWQNQHFNQGAPKPDGQTPGQTSGPSGTFDLATGAFQIGWKSLIQGGPFNNFTGQWHFEGNFEAGAVAPSTAASKGANATSQVKGERLATTGWNLSQLLGSVLLLLSLVGYLLVRPARGR